MTTIPSNTRSKTSSVSINLINNDDTPPPVDNGVISSICMFVPLSVESYLSNASSNSQSIAPICTELIGSLLFVDMSGFTPLSERLCSQGSVGIEMLSQHLNQYFGGMMNIIHSHQGDVIKFAGDAIMVLFSSPIQNDNADDEEMAHTSIISDHCYRACVCGLALHAAYDYYTPSSEITLRLHSAVSAGIFYALHIGSETRREWLVEGTPLKQITTAMKASEKGQIVLHYSAYRSVKQLITAELYVSDNLADTEQKEQRLFNKSTVQNNESCYLLLSCHPKLSLVVAASSSKLKSRLKVNTSPPFSSHHTPIKAGSLGSSTSISILSNSKLPGDSPISMNLILQRRLQLALNNSVASLNVTDALRAYVPSAVLPRILAGHAAWLAEFRRVTTLFIQLPHIEFDFRTEKSLAAEKGISFIAQRKKLLAANVDRLQSISLLMMNLCEKNKGDVRQLITDDKGTVLILLFGLQADWANPSRAVRCAVEICDAMEKKKLGSVHIGMTTGQVFCCTVGNPIRCEYIAIGDKVNTAARLMGAAMNAKEKIFLCADTVKAVGVSLRNHSNPSGHSLYFKSLPPIMMKGKSAPFMVYVPYYERQLRMEEKELKAAKLNSPQSKNRIEPSDEFLLRNSSGDLVVGEERREQWQEVEKFLLSIPWKKNDAQLSSLVLECNRMIIISTSAGMGKTLFLKTIKQRCAQLGCVVFQSQAQDSVQSPYFVFHTIIPELLKHLWRIKKRNSHHQTTVKKKSTFDFRDQNTDNDFNIIKEEGKQGDGDEEEEVEEEFESSEWLNDPCSLSLPSSLMKDATSLVILNDCCPKVNFQHTVSISISLNKLVHMQQQGKYNKISNVTPRQFTSAQSSPVGIQRDSNISQTHASPSIPLYNSSTSPDLSTPLSPLSTSESIPITTSNENVEKSQIPPKVVATAQSISDLLATLFLHIISNSITSSPIALIIDDAHWLDSASEEILMMLSKRLTSTRFIFAIREDNINNSKEQSSVAEGDKHAEPISVKDEALVDTVCSLKKRLTPYQMRQKENDIPSDKVITKSPWPLHRALTTVQSNSVNLASTPVYNESPPPLRLSIASIPSTYSPSYSSTSSPHSLVTSFQSQQIRHQAWGRMRTLVSLPSTSSSAADISASPSDNNAASNSLFSVFVTLGPLKEKEMSDFLKCKLGCFHIDKLVLNFLLERSNGNPLFAEELASTLSKSGIITITEEAQHAVTNTGDVRRHMLSAEYIEQVKREQISTTNQHHHEENLDDVRKDPALIRDPLGRSTSSYYRVASFSPGWSNRVDMNSLPISMDEMIASKLDSFPPALQLVSRLSAVFGRIVDKRCIQSLFDEYGCGMVKKKESPLKQSINHSVAIFDQNLDNQSEYSVCHIDLIKSNKERDFDSLCDTLVSLGIVAWLSDQPNCYTFKSASTQSVLYHRIPFSLRGKLHQFIAEWYLSEYPTFQLQQFYYQVAHHYYQATSALQIYQNNTTHSPSSSPTFQSPITPPDSKISSADKPITSNTAASTSNRFSLSACRDSAIYYLRMAGESAVKQHAKKEAVLYLRQCLTLLNSLPDSESRQFNRKCEKLFVLAEYAPTYGNLVGISYATETFAKLCNLCEEVQLMPEYINLQQGKDQDSNISKGLALVESEKEQVNSKFSAEEIARSSFYALRGYHFALRGNEIIINGESLPSRLLSIAESSGDNLLLMHALLIMQIENASLGKVHESIQNNARIQLISATRSAFVVNPFAPMDPMVASFGTCSMIHAMIGNFDASLKNQSQAFALAEKFGEPVGFQQTIFSCCWANYVMEVDQIYGPKYVERFWSHVVTSGYQMVSLLLEVLFVLIQINPNVDFDLYRETSENIWSKYIAGGGFWLELGSPVCLLLYNAKLYSNGLEFVRRWSEMLDERKRLGLASECYRFKALFLLQEAKSKRYDNQVDMNKNLESISSDNDYELIRNQSMKKEEYESTLVTSVIELFEYSILLASSQDTYLLELKSQLNLFRFLNSYNLDNMSIDVKLKKDRHKKRIAQLIKILIEWKAEENKINLGVIQLKDDDVPSLDIRKLPIIVAATRMLEEVED